MSAAEPDNASGGAGELDEVFDALDALDALDEVHDVEAKTQALPRPPKFTPKSAPSADDTPSPDEARDGAEAMVDESGSVDEVHDDSPSPDGASETHDNTPSPDEASETHDNTPSPDEANSADADTKSLSPAAEDGTESDTVAISQDVVPASAAESEVAAAAAAERADDALAEAQQNREAARAKVKAARKAREQAVRAVEQAFSSDEQAVRLSREALQRAVVAKDHADHYLTQLIEGQSEDSKRWEELAVAERTARESVASLRAEAEAAKAEAEERRANQEAVQASSKKAEQEAESKAKAAEKVRSLVADKERAAKEASRVAKRAENDARVAAAAVAEAMSELEELKEFERRAATSVARAAAAVLDSEEGVENAEEQAEATKEQVEEAEAAASEARKLLDSKRQSMATGELSPEEISEIALAIGTLASEAKSKQQLIEAAKAQVDEANDSIQSAKNILATSQKTARKQQAAAEKAANAREEAAAKLEELQSALAQARKVADERSDAAGLVREEARQASEDTLTEVSRDGAEAVAKAEETASAWRSAARQFESARARSDALQRQLQRAEQELADARDARASMQDAQETFAQRKEHAENAVRSSAERAWRAETRLGRLEDEARAAAEELRPALYEARADSEADAADEVDGDSTDFNLGLGDLFGEEDIDTMRFDREKLEAAGLSSSDSALSDLHEDEGATSFWLTISTADGLQGKHEFENDVVVLGRDPNCDVTLDNMLVSRRHAEIRRRGDFFALVDLGTSNGTLLNGSKVSGLTILNNGDGIGVGKFRIRFEADFASAFGMPSPDSSVSGDLGDVETIGGMTLRMTPETEQRVIEEGKGQLGCVVIRDKNGKEARSPIGETFLIGKSPNCDLRLRGWFVPRKAAMIVRGLANYKVENLSDSPSSILVNGKPVATRSTLSDGDTIEVYGQRVGFSLPTS